MFSGTAEKTINITTDSMLAIVGTSWSDVTESVEYRIVTFYSQTGFVDNADCSMQYVRIDGNTSIYDHAYGQFAGEHSSLLMLKHAEHLDVINCRLALQEVESSRLRSCAIYENNGAIPSLTHTKMYECEVSETLWGAGAENSPSIISSSVLHWNNFMDRNYSKCPFASTKSAISGNAILNRLNSPAMWFRTYAVSGDINLRNNFWGTDNPTVISDIIIDSNDIVTYGTITYEPFLTKSSDMSSIYPFVVDAWITDADGNRIEDVIGAQEVTFHVLFNRDMNTNDDLTVAYGPAEPYNDYRVTGEWKSARKWEGTYQVNPIIDYGTMYIYVAGGHAADDYWLETAPDSRHWFEISNSGAEALVLQSWAEGDGIHLTWTQDDFETLAGYNLYRTQTLGEIYDENWQPIGTAPVHYQKINPVLIPADTLSYVDADVVEGETYYYYFTVVQTDFAESDGSNVTTCTALDMTKPVINHTQIASILTGQSLSVSAEVTDNVKVDSVTLHTRVQGGSWTDTKMVNTNGSLWYANLVVNGTKPIEYYISATDGVGTASWKSANAPAVVVVESPEFTLGDLNADGTVDIVDLMTVTQSIVGTKTLTVTQAKAADVNADGTVDVFDLMKIAQRICGMIGSL